MIFSRDWQAQLLKALKDMSDVDDNDLDVTPVRDNGFNGQLAVSALQLMQRVFICKLQLCCRVRLYTLFAEFWKQVHCSWRELLEPYLVMWVYYSTGWPKSETISIAGIFQIICMIFYQAKMGK